MTGGRRRGAATCSPVALMRSAPPADLAAQVEAARRAGRYRVVPPGMTGIATKLKPPSTPPRFHPDHCGSGHLVRRAPHLDEYDLDPI